MNEKTKKCIKIIIPILYIYLIMNSIYTILTTIKLYETSNEVFVAGSNYGVSGCICIYACFELILMIMKKLKESKKVSE